MKILQLCGFYPPVIGGIEAYVKEMSENLTSKGHEVTVIARYIIGKKPNKRIVKENKVKIIWLYSNKNTKLTTLWAWIQAFFIAYKQKFDVIHAHTIVPINIVGNLLKILKRKRLICTIHETNFQKGINNPIYRMIARLSLNNADFVYGISDDITVKANSLHLNKKVITCKNAVDNKIFKKFENNIIRKNLHLPKNVKILITTRRLVEKNGVIYLIQSIPYLLEDDKEIFLYIIGSGPEKQKMQEEIKNLNIQKFVHINSNVETPDLPLYLSDADVFVLPSLIEGMSMSALEALSCELPIVATNVGGNPQFIREGNNGYLCEPKNPKDLAQKIKKLLSENYKQFGKNSREMITRDFSWDNRINEIIKIYNSK